MKTHNAPSRTIFSSPCINDYNDNTENHLSLADTSTGGNNKSHNVLKKFTAKTPTKNSRPQSRNPLESLSSFVNSFELKTVGSKISHSASSIRRSMSHRFGDFPLFPPADDTSDDSEAGNDSTLNDDEWLASPSQKQKVLSTFRPAASPILPGIIVNANEQLASNEHLPATRISTFSVAQDNLPRIDEYELSKIIAGNYADQFDEYVVIDCRFPYEFRGGHIINAVNISSQQDLEEKFITGFNVDSSCSKRLLIFHCEYSVFRGPTMAAHLRKADRLFNSERYPYLLHPDIVVLEGGYKNFYDKFRHCCEPQAYVTMKDNNHKRTCEVEMSKVLQASKLTRAKSFNNGPPRLSASHARSASLTALLTSSEVAVGTSWSPSVRNKKSLKIKKKDRRDSRCQFTQSLQNLPSAYDYPRNDSSMCSRFENEDLIPPTALFRNSKSYSSLNFSSNSSQSSLCSESLSPTCSSSESLSESASPFNEPCDYFDSLCSADSAVTHTPDGLIISRSNTSLDSGVRSEPRVGTPVHVTQSGVSIPNQKVSRVSLSRPIPRPNAKVSSSSPTFSSPLSIKPASAFVSSTPYDSRSVVDPINESPVDFSLNFRNSSSKRQWGSYSHIQSLDLDEVSEESFC